jgi:hypothetical protein
MSDGDSDLRKYSRRSAIGLMGIGGGLAATETLGFTRLTADRALSISIANDKNASLRITVEEGQSGGYDDTLTDEPFSGNSNVKFENAGNSDITSGSGDAITVDISSTDHGSITFDDNGGDQSFTFVDGDTEATTSDGVTAEADLPSGDDAVLSVAPTNDNDGNSPTVGFTITATPSDGIELDIERQNVTFEE